MKYKFLIILLIPAWLVSVNASAQTEADYQALTDFLSPDKISALQSKPQQYAQVAYLNRHGYHVSEMGEKSTQAISDISQVTAIYEDVPAITIELVSTGELNLMAYNFDTSADRDSFYKFGNSSKVLVILATTRALRMANLLEH